VGRGGRVRVSQTGKKGTENVILLCKIRKKNLKREEGLLVDELVNVSQRWGKIIGETPLGRVLMNSDFFATQDAGKFGRLSE